MNKRFALLLTLLILVPVLVAACGGDDDDDGGSSDVSLGQSFETTQEGVTLKFDFPDEWVSEEQTGAVAIATSQDVVESLGGDNIPELSGEDAGMALLPFPAALLTLEGDAEEVSAAAAIDSFGAQVVGENDFTLGENEEAEFNGKTAARATLSGENGSGEFFVIESSEDFFLFALYITGEYDDDAKATAEAILNSIELTVEG